MRGRDNSTVGREVRTDRTRILKQFPCGRPAGGWRTKGECADCGLALAIGSSTCRFQDHESVKLAFDRFVAPLGNQDLPCRADVVWLRLYIGPIRPPSLIIFISISPALTHKHRHRSQYNKPHSRIASLLTIIITASLLH